MKGASRVLHHFVSTSSAPCTLILSLSPSSTPLPQQRSLLLRSEMGGGSEMSSASSSRDKKRRPRFECHCGVDAPLVTSWTDENPGRRFYGCGRFKVNKARDLWYYSYGSSLCYFDFSDLCCSDYCDLALSNQL